MTDIRAVLFDIDGTLIDSNYLQVDAWQRAFRELGEEVDAWRIHRAIAEDSASLLKDLVGERDEDWTSRVKDLHERLYLESVPRLRRFAGARELLTRLHDAGTTIVLATSAPEVELAELRKVLDAGDLVTAETSAEDVEEAKPDPGIVNIALERAGVEPDQALFVGDSVWDMVAARRAGVTPLGVGSGGIGANELTDAGAAAVFDDVAEIDERLGAFGGDLDGFVASLAR